jgi:hypothetical protein
MAIPIEKIIDFTALVNDTSTQGVDLVTTVLTKNVLLENGTEALKSFVSAEAVALQFGSTSDEYYFAVKYFLGRKNSTLKPRFINFGRYIDTDVAPYIKSGKMLGIDLASLIAVTNGTINFSFNYVTTSVTGIDLSSATSFSQVASLIHTAMQVPIGAGSICTYNAVIQKFIISNGDTSHVAVDYVTDSTGTGLGSLLKLTKAKGASLSQGSTDLTPDQNMNALLAISTNWIAFTTIWDLSAESGYATALALASWTNTLAPRYVFLAWSTETNLYTSGNTANMVYAIINSGYKNVSPIKEKSPATPYDISAFVGGMGASIDYEDGTRIEFANKSQDGLGYSASSAIQYDGLTANKCNFYGLFKEDNQDFSFFRTGSITGDYKFACNVYDYVWLQNQVKIELAVLMGISDKLDYGANGQNAVSGAIDTVMGKAINNQVVQAGNTFDDIQKALMRQQAGIDISKWMTQQGYYVKLTPPSPSQRILKLPMNIKIWYTNNGGWFSITGTITLQG